MDARDAFSERLVLERCEALLTQEELAKALGISRQAITQYERKLRVPDIEMVRKFAEYFHVTTDYLIGLSDNRTNETSAIGEKIGLSDEAIKRLQGYVKLSKLPEEPRFLTTKRICNNALAAVNRICAEQELLDAIGDYIFSQTPELFNEIKIVKESKEGDVPDPIFDLQKNKVMQAYTLNRIDSGLENLRQTIQKERKNDAQKDKRQE